MWGVQTGRGLAALHKENISLAVIVNVKSHNLTCSLKLIINTMQRHGNVLVEQGHCYYGSQQTVLKINF